MATLLGYKIEDRCPCGVSMAIGDRQELALDKKNDVWMRVCVKCINAGSYFKPPLDVVTDEAPQEK